MKYLGNIASRNALRRLTGTATDGVVMALIGNIEGHILVATCIQEHKNGPYNKTANITLKCVPDRCKYGPSTHAYNYCELPCVL